MCLSSSSFECITSELIYLLVGLLIFWSCSLCVDQLSGIARGQRQVMHQLDNLNNLLRERVGERSRQGRKTQKSNVDAEPIKVPLILTLAVGGLGIYLFRSFLTRNWFHHQILISHFHINLLNSHFLQIPTNLWRGTVSQINSPFLLRGIWILRRFSRFSFRILMKRCSRKFCSYRWVILAMFYLLLTTNCKDKLTPKE